MLRCAGPLELPRGPRSINKWEARRRQAFRRIWLNSERCLELVTAQTKGSRWAYLHTDHHLRQFGVQLNYVRGYQRYTELPTTRIGGQAA